MREQKNRLTRRAFIGGATAFGAAVSLSPSLAFAETSAEKQAEADTVRIQVTNMQSQLEQASDDYYRALEEHDEAQSNMEAAQKRIDDINGQIETVQGKLSTRAKSMYRTGTSSFIDCLLGAATFEEFANNWSLLNSLNQEDADLVQQCKDLRTEAQTQEEEYSRQEQIAAQKTAEAEQIKNQAEATVSQLQATLDSLDAEAKELLEQEQAAAAAAANAQAQAEAEAAAASGGSYTYDTSNGGSGTINYDSGSAANVPTNGSVVDYALSRIGCPYVWGAEGPNSFDCSGLTTWCYRQVGISIPHQSESQYACASAVMPVSSAAPGDILWRYGHVGIAQISGGSQYIHAPTFGAYVRNTDALSWAGFTAALRI